MARTTPANNANAAYGAESQGSYNAAQSDIGKFNQKQTKLDAGLNVGANPFLNSGYLSNVNKLQSEALNTNADSSKAEMQRRLQANGGLNGSQTALAQRDVGLQTGRLADTLSAQRSADDYKSNLSWQQYLAQQPLQAAGAESSLYGTATGGQGNALNNLTQLSGQRYGFWGPIIQSAVSGAAMGAAGCWIAEALYGEDDAKTHLLRSWLNDEFKTHSFGRAVMKLYYRFGERIAAKIRKHPRLGWLFRPFFELALVFAVRDRVREAI